MEQTSRILIEWYGANRRELPWRETTDPYRIWISEVILQQTRVAQGLGYYLRFTGRFPDVRSLAAASEDEVLRLWQGLGYYSRARSLHAAARDVAGRFGGVFPRSYDEVRSLSGVGDYTAAAVCSIAYGMPKAVVDGNVVRVLSRLFDADIRPDTADGKRYFAELAQELLDPRRAALHNQAVMEFGALQCTPRNPDCTGCPLAAQCLSLARGTVTQRPLKRPKAEVLPRYFHYLHIRCGGTVLLGKRTGKDIWRNLYEFPLIETDSPADFAGLQRTAAWKELLGEGASLRLLRETAMPPHVLSHRVIHARFYEISLDKPTPALSRYLPVAPQELSGYAVSRLTEAYLERTERG